MTNSAVVKYLAQHADPLSAAVGEDVWERVRAAHPTLPSRFVHGLMIPAFAEGRGLVEVLRSVPAWQPSSAGGQRAGVVAVVVVNRPPVVTPTQQAAHDESLAAVRAAWPEVARLHAQVTAHAWPQGLLLLVDTVLPRKRGVGQARKIGCDVLLRLWANGRLRYPWLHMGDADALWPADFWPRIAAFQPGTRPPAALVRAFRHEATAQEHAEACLRYEIRLRLHVLGLQRAGSPYAYHAIGSTISCHAKAYAQVRGVPRRPAAEDFYLLNKLAKLGPIVHLPGAPTRVSGRESDRVPFGTGATMRSSVAEGSLPRCYAGEIFDLLRIVLETMERALLAGGSFDASLPPDLAAALPAGLGARGVEIFTGGVAARGVAELVAEVQATGLPLKERRRRLHERFDAFATLKLMHAWRERGLPDVPVEDALVAMGGCQELEFSGRKRGSDAGEGSRGWLGVAELQAVVECVAGLERASSC